MMLCTSYRRTVHHLSLARSLALSLSRVVISDCSRGVIYTVLYTVMHKTMYKVKHNVM